MANQKIMLNTVWSGYAKGNGTLKSDNLQTQIAIPISKGGSEKVLTPNNSLCLLQQLAI